MKTILYKKVFEKSRIQVKKGISVYNHSQNQKERERER
jgi:hypothetical protein